MSIRPRHQDRRLPRRECRNERRRSQHVDVRRARDATRRRARRIPHARATVPPSMKPAPGATPSRPPTTRTSTSPPSSSPDACAPTSRASTPSAASPTTSATKSATPAPLCDCSKLGSDVRPVLRRARGNPVIPSSSPSRETIVACDLPPHPLPRSAARLSAGPGQDPLRDLGRGRRILAATPPTPSAASSSWSAAIAMNAAPSSPTRSAPACSSPTSGRMSSATPRSPAATSPPNTCSASASPRARSKAASSPRSSAP